ncbi:GroES-like protein [Nemania abortiva]|nr:GroES-like protein [Nemania abortiva]
MSSIYSRTQTAVIQLKAQQPSGLPLSIASSRPIPALPTPYHVLVRVLAVGLNPTDCKMIKNFYMEGNIVGCDFCGIVELVGSSSVVPVGVRVIGADFPYRPNNPYNGAFAEYAVCDSRQTLHVPEDWSDTKAAALGAIGFGTACLALFDPDALNLEGRPSRPVEKPIPVLIHGGASATGLIAIQMLKQSGYVPIAVCSDKSAPMVLKYGAIGTASYTTPDCVARIKALAGGKPVKRALDCITNPQSVAICFDALARVGARYACLEACPDAWRTRPSMMVKIVMGFEANNVDVDLGHPAYARKANPELHTLVCSWIPDLQSMINRGFLEPQPHREIDGGFDGVIKAMEMLHSGEVKGQKLTVRIASR